MGLILTIICQQRQISSWYADDAWFVFSAYPWFLRGVNYYDGTESGVFAFAQSPGHAHANHGYRIVLAI